MESTIRRFGWFALVAILTSSMTIGLTSCDNDDDDETTVDATLTGSDETPPVNTAATGQARFTINHDRTEIQYTLEVENLSGPPLAAHIHPGARGVSGPPMITLANPGSGTSGSSSGTLTGDSGFSPAPALGINTFADAIDAILAGQTYTNVHTAANPGGEIRGQNED